ncbi:SEC-C metal-binding domain-containing protein [Vulgatibacter sp.]|uniref:SEC-C metal-binding domain-containing protein n=1 Tax=Vulgatibacter sp. TaxID=1971226 RepID=UPI00356B417C
MAAANEWVGGIIASTGDVVEEGAAFRPSVAVWLDVKNDQLLATELCRPEHAAAALAGALQKALERSEGRPAALRVAEEAWVDAVRAAAGGPVSIAVGPTPELGPLEENLAAFLAEGPQMPGYTAEGTIPPERVERLFRAARRFFQAQPWKVAAEEEVFAVDVPELGIEGGCLIVIGAQEEARGFTLFPDVDTYLAFVEAVSEEEGLPVGPFLHLGFEQEQDLGPTMRAELQRYGWKAAAPGAVPALLALDEDGLTRELEELDHVLATALAEAVVDLVEKHPELPEEADETSSHDGLPEVRLQLPHPEIDSLDEVIVYGFLEEEEAQGRDLELAESVAVHALDFKEASEADPVAWSPAEVEEFLLVYVPKKVSYSEEELLLLPRVFGRFLRFLGESFEVMDEKRIRRLLDHVDELLGRFRLAIGDPSRWAPAKRLAMLAHQRGVDLTDREAMAGLVNEMNAQQLPSVRLAPKVGRNDPCPCGSGKKHKKCCGA